MAKITFTFEDVEDRVVFIVEKPDSDEGSNASAMAYEVFQYVQQLMERSGTVVH